MLGEHLADRRAVRRPARPGHAGRGGRRREEKIYPGRVRELLRHPHLWAHVLGNTGWQVLCWTFAIFGQTVLVDAFGMETGAADGVVALGIVLNALAVIAVGRLSDRLQTRKPFTAAGTILTVASLAYFVALIGRPGRSGDLPGLDGRLQGRLAPRPHPPADAADPEGSPLALVRRVTAGARPAPPAGPPPGGPCRGRRWRGRSPRRCSGSRGG
ncbi:MFS transporter [Nonomuraea typhae]|uniref:MFS transporter n=1 Tax=Nonomuraea typhae TaxID=2603600 RepID=A0ABW7YJM6_9ACTN